MLTPNGRESSATAHKVRSLNKDPKPSISPLYVIGLWSTSAWKRNRSNYVPSCPIIAVRAISFVTGDCQLPATVAWASTLISLMRWQLLEKSLKGGSPLVSYIYLSCTVVVGHAIRPDGLDERGWPSRERQTGNEQCFSHPMSGDSVQYLTYQVYYYGGKGAIALSMCASVPRPLGALLEWNWPYGFHPYQARMYKELLAWSFKSPVLITRAKICKLNSLEFG